MLNKVFNNRYRLVEKLGIGGMAEVYKATDEVLGRTVAVKVMLPQYANDKTFAARFKQEAQAAANLQSPYIVNIYDWGYDNADASYFIVMEYIRGTDLKTAINQRGTINQRKVAEIASQVCAALNVAHGYDIIHRDIKPHNIMVQPDGNAKVMDFGIARASGSSMTQTGSVLGTAYYVSPEQAQGKQLTPATDLYSLGIVMYEATTGKVPFDAPDAVSVALKQVNEMPAPPSRINPNIDPELEKIIMRAMEKNPLRRYATAEQMRTALNNYLAGRPVDDDVEQAAEQTRVMGAAATLPIIRKDGAQPPVHTAVMPSLAGGGPAINIHSSAKAREAEQKRKRRTVTIIAVVIGLIVVAVAGFAVYSIVNKETPGSEKVDVPNVIGMTEELAREEIETSGLVVGKIDLQTSSTVEKGRVISTDPKARTKVDKGSAVNLVVSNGPEAPKQVEVPNLTNMTQGQAEDALKKAGLVPRRGDDRYSRDIEKDRVCGQDVDPGEMVSEGIHITFYISKGKETVYLPNVVGANYVDAEDTLTKAGFTIVYNPDEFSFDYQDKIVMRQSPLSGQVEPGATVTLTVSKGPEPITVPDLYGMTESEARAALAKYPKLIVVPMTAETTELTELHKVIRQEPGVGAPVAHDGVIYIYIGVEAKPSSGSSG